MLGVVALSIAGLLPVDPQRQYDADLYGGRAAG